MSPNRTILAIETSCDETSAALVKNGTDILHIETASSMRKHRKTGGIVPEVGARQQVHDIIPVIQSCLQDVSPHDIDAIAVTVGPGLIGSLVVGVETAKILSWAWQKPIIPVDHVVAHVYGAWLTDKAVPELPALGLVISGGHTEFVLIKNHGDVVFLGGTRDDAAGEAFDKTARLLGMPYPGGPEIEKASKEGNAEAVSLPLPLAYEKTSEMSFSGLKTAVRNHILSQNGNTYTADTAASFQKTVTEILSIKTHYTLENISGKPKSLILAGGVAANRYIADHFKKVFSDTLEVYVTPLMISVDNAAMIASYAHFNFHPEPIDHILPDPNYHARTVGTSKKINLT